MQYINRRAIVIFLLLPLLLFLSIAISSCTNENGASESKRTDGSKESLLIGFSQVNHATQIIDDIIFAIPDEEPLKTELDNQQ